MTTKPYFANIRDKASSMVNHIESTMDMQRTAVFPVHFARGSESHLGESSWFHQHKYTHNKQEGHLTC